MDHENKVLPGDQWRIVYNDNAVATHVICSVVDDCANYVDGGFDRIGTLFKEGTLISRSYGDLDINALSAWLAARGWCLDEPNRASGRQVILHLRPM